MIRTFAVALLAMLFFSKCTQPIGFEAYFTNATLRVDYAHIGHAKLDSVALENTMEYGIWAGSQVNLVDTLPYGTYVHVLKDAASGKVIYSRGFDSYFKEYKVSRLGLEEQQKIFYESAIFPMPVHEAIFELHQRMPSGEVKTIFSSVIDPAQVKKVTPDELVDDVTVIETQKSGDPSVKADVVIVAEGYTAEEKEKFEADMKRFTEVFFTAEPCKSNRELFNVYGVFKPSEDSGIDEPRAGIDKNTAVNATFNTMGSERYVLTEDNQSLRDIASHVPYDAIYIMVNTKRYGGGGIYNFYCTFPSDNVYGAYIMVHEFGHSFFALADEYYSSATAYEDFYPVGYEPAEANITAETDPSKVKWRHLFTEGIEIPTPWDKAEYDRADSAWQVQRTFLNNEIARLQKEGHSDVEIEAAKKEYDQRSMEQDSIAQAFLAGRFNSDKVGLFEGAGYASEGLYRGSINCIMFTKTSEFCPICQEAMTGIIHWYAN